MINVGYYKIASVEKSECHKRIELDFKKKMMSEDIWRPESRIEDGAVQSKVQIGDSSLPPIVSQSVPQRNSTKYDERKQLDTTKHCTTLQ